MLVNIHFQKWPLQLFNNYNNNNKEEIEVMVFVKPKLQETRGS